MPASKHRSAGMLHRILALAALACIMCGVEWSAGRMYWLTPEQDESQKELMQAKQAAMRDTTEYDVLVLGDSTAGNDFIPDLFTRITGRSAYDMHTNINVSIVANVYLLQEYLAHHAAPKLVIVIQTLNAITVPQHHDLLLEHFMRPGIAWTLWTHGTFSLPEFSEALLTQLLPSLRYRRHILRLRQTDDLIAGLLGKGTGQFTDRALGHIPVTRDITKMEAYAGEMRTHSEFLSEAAGKHYAGITSEAITMLPELCSIAAANKFRLAFVPPPVPQRVMDSSGAIVGARALEREILSRIAPDGCTLIGTIALPDIMFGDGAHLNETGATVFTTKLADFLSSALAGG